MDSSARGRGRITLEHDGPWQSRPGTQLVIISRQADDFQERLRSALLAVVGHEDDDSAASAPATDVLCEPCDGTNEDDYDAVEEAERVRVRLRDDPRFDLIIAADGECANSSSSDSLLGKRTRDGADEHPLLWCQYLWCTSSLLALHCAAYSARCSSACTGST